MLPDDCNKPVYMQIRNLIQAKNIPLREIAEKANIPVRRFYHVMDGTCSLLADELKRICAVEELNINVEEFLRL